MKVIYEYDGGKKKKFIAEIKEETAKKKELVDKPQKNNKTQEVI